MKDYWKKFIDWIKDIKNIKVDRNKTIKYLILWAKILFVTFAVSMLLFTIISVKKLNHDAGKGIMGYKMFTVLSDSMKPEFEAGDVILVKEIKTDKLKSGDVITFYSKEGPIVTHRINEVTEVEGERAFITQGVNVDQPDKDPVLEKRVIGRYSFAIPNAGHFFQFIKTPTGYVTLVLIPFLVIIGFYAYNFFKLLMEYKKEKKDKMKQLEADKLKAEEELKKLKEQLNNQKNMNT